MRIVFTLGLALCLALSGCQSSTSPTPNASASAGAKANQDEHGHDHGEEEHADEHGHSEGEEGHEEGEEGFVTLTAAQRKEIGLEIASPVSGSVTGTTRTGRVEADPDRSVVISPQVAGTVKTLPVIIGSRVRQGDVIAVVESPEIAVLKGEYHNAEVEVDLAAKELANTEALFAIGDESRREVEEATLQLGEAKAASEAVEARLTSARLTHERLQTLREEGIASAQQVEQALAERKALEADLRKAKSAIAIAKQHLDRETRVSKSQLRRKSETFPAEASLARARENLKHLEERLLQLGANLGEGGTVTLTSPIDGQVIKRPVNRGQAVSSGDVIAELVDPSHVWVMIDLTRADLTTVKLGDRVTVALANDSDVQASGEISYIDPQVEAESQTVRARVELTGAGGKFRLGSFVNATLNSESDLPSLPKEALQNVEGATVVYRVEGDGFRRTPVKVLSQGADGVVVSGLGLGSQVVTKGAADLKALDLSSTIGGHSH